MNQNNFRLINKYRDIIVKTTNIENCPKEFESLLPLLYRMNQLGWLEVLDKNLPDIKNTEPDKKLTGLTIQDLLDAYQDLCDNYGLNCNDCPLGTPPETCFIMQQLEKLVKY